MSLDIISVHLPITFRFVIFILSTGCHLGLRQVYQSAIELFSIFGHEVIALFLADRCFCLLTEPFGRRVPASIRPVLLTFIVHPVRGSTQHRAQLFGNLIVQ